MEAAESTVRCCVLSTLREEGFLEEAVPVLNPDRCGGAGQEGKWTRANPHR